MWVGDFVPGLATFRRRGEDAAASQTGEVIGHVGARELEVSGKLCGVSGLLEQAHQYAGASRVGHRATESVHHVKTVCNSQHTLTIQP